jgi:hypothetical protein
MNHFGEFFPMMAARSVPKDRGANMLYAPQLMV